MHGLSHERQVLCNISFTEHLPEDGHNSWPKHVAGHTVYTTVNLHICIYALVDFISHNESSVHRHASFKNEEDCVKCNCRSSQVRPWCAWLVNVSHLR